MSVGFRYEFSEIVRLARQLENVAAEDFDDLLHALAVEGESQTRRRISVEKSAPDGSAWPKWSDDYATTRHGGHSLLENEGDLLDSLQSFVDSNAAGWGTNLIYGAIHQFGSDEAVQVPAHQRLVTQAFGRELRFPVYANVRAYTFKQNIPGRAYLGLSLDNEEDLLAIAHDWLDDKLKGHLNEH